MKPVCVRFITLSCMMGFEYNLAQKIIMTRQCIENNRHISRPKVNVTVKLCIGFSETCSYAIHNFVMNDGI